MEKCELVEQGEGWLVRDIYLFGEELTERVTFEPERLVTFVRTKGRVPGVIINEILGEDDDLRLKFGFELSAEGIEEAAGRGRVLRPHRPPPTTAPASTLAAMRRLVAEQGREALTS
jgi:hypothetical protein